RRVEQRSAVRRGCDHYFAADDSGSAGAVLDHELLMQALPQLLSEQPCHHVHASTRRDWNYYSHGRIGILGCPNRANNQEQRYQKRRSETDDHPVPPTVMRSMRSVGWPTPTGTPCPFLPQVPIPGSSSRSLPIMLMRLRSVGPLPINMAPLSGSRSFPSSM